MRGLIIFLAMWSIGCTLPAFQDINDFDRDVNPQNVFVDYSALDSFCNCDYHDYTLVVFFNGQSNVNTPESYVSEIPNGMLNDIPDNMWMVTVNSNTAVLEKSDPTKNHTNNRQGVNFGMEFQLLRMLAPHYKNVVGIKYAESGRPLVLNAAARDFSVNSIGEAHDSTIVRFNRALNPVRAQFGQDFRTDFVWIHGEADADALSAPLYYNELEDYRTSMIANFDTVGGHDALPMKFVVTELVSEAASDFNTVIAAQQQLSASYPYTEFVKLKPFVSLDVDNVHWNANGSIVAGARAYPFLRPTQKYNP